MGVRRRRRSRRGDERGWNSILYRALAFLHAHPGNVSPITVTLWGNDVFALSARGRHAHSTIASFGKRFSSILAKLRAAAPNAEIIVSRHRIRRKVDLSAMSSILRTL